MDYINNTMSAATALTTLEGSLAAVGITVDLSPSMSAEELCAALNTAFIGVTGYTQVNSSMSSADFCEVVNGNLDLVKEGQDGDNVFKFLHFSDPHGYISAQEKIKDLINNDPSIQFALCTGDMSRYFGRYPSSTGTDKATAKTNYKASFTALTGKLLMLAGNHDAYDGDGFRVDFGTGNGRQAQCTNAIYRFIRDSGTELQWGDTDGNTNIPVTASYWYKDYTLNDGNKLRMFGLDQYEIDVVANSPGNYDTRFSKKQLNWFIDKLLELNEDDYFIIAQHTMQFFPGSNALPAVPYDPRLLFVTEDYNGNTSAYNWYFIANIVKTYKNKGLYTYSGSKPEISDTEAGWQRDLSSAKGATFLFFLCGHTHYDCVAYNALSGYEEQLMMCITAADIRVEYAKYTSGGVEYGDDLGGNPNSTIDTRTDEQFGDTPKYRINEVIIDFDKETIAVNRIGTHITEAGRDRNTITFPFVREINNQQ